LISSEPLQKYISYREYHDTTKRLGSLAASIRRELEADDIEPLIAMLREG
jgi:hypothetical protein